MIQAQGNENVKLVSVTDPVPTPPAWPTTPPPADPTFKWSLQTLTEGHNSTYQMDTAGRPVHVTNAKSQKTRPGWDGDNNVTSLIEDNGAKATWTYDQNTGYLGSRPRQQL